MNCVYENKTDLATYVVTGIPLSVLVIRHFVPSFVMDNYTIYLLLLAMSPWLAPWIKTLELSGVARVDFNNMEDAAKQAGLLEDGGKMDFISKIGSIFPITSDTKSKLAKMGVELADNLSKLAASQGMPPQKDITQVIDFLSREKIIDENHYSMLLGVANISNALLKGKSVNSRIAGLALKIGPKLLASLKERAETP